MLKRAALICYLAFISVSLMASDSVQDQLKALRERAAREHWTFSVGDNPAAHRTLDQLTGLKIPADWKKTARTQTLPKMRSLPSAFDWRAQGGVSSVKDQGQCGSCWAFGTLGAFEAEVLIKTGHEYDFSEQAIVSCNTQGWGCQGGNAAFDELNQPGAVMESCMPYQASDSVSCELGCARDFKAQSWYYVDPYVDVPSVEELKTAIYLYGPIAVGVAVDTAFSYYSGGVFDGTYDQVNHLPVLVGWDDSLGDHGAWILKNSWSTGWGLDGYMQIAYSANMIGEAATYGVFQEGGSGNCLEPEGAWALGPLNGAAVKDNRLFYGSGATLMEADISDPSAPRTLGSLSLPGAVKGLAVNGDTLYIAADTGGLCIVDIPSLTLISRVGLPRKSLTVIVNGSVAYVGGNQGIRVVDVTNPHTPVDKGGVGGFTDVESLKVQGTTLYATDGSSGFGILDLSDPLHPAQISKTSVGVYVAALDISGVNLFLACWAEGIIVMDVSNPAAPVQKGTGTLQGSAYDLVLSGSRAFVAGYTGGLRVMDISNPAAPVEAGSLSLGGNAYSITLAGTRAILPGSSTGLAIADVSTPQSPALLGRLSAVGTTLHVSADDAGHLFLAQRDKGIKVLGLNGSAWTEIGSYDTTGRALKTFPVGTSLLVADESGGLVILDVTDPAHPSLAAQVALDGKVLSVTASGGIAFATDDTCGLQIIDISSPHAPVKKGKACDPHAGNGVAVQGNFAYVADDADGLRIFDVSNPSAPVQIGQMAPPVQGRAQAVAVQGNYAYVAQGQMGMQVVDVTNPAAPVDLGGDGGPSSGNDVAVSGAHVLLADGTSGVRMYDATDPSKPVRVGYYPVTKEAMALALKDDNLYVADSTLGLEIFKVRECLPGSVPAADFSVNPSEGTALWPIAFLDHSTNTPTSWLWDFGDGSTSTMQNPTHTYVYSGYFSVSLTAANTFGGGSVTKTITIHPADTPPPVTAPGSQVYIIPAAAKAAGAQNSNWLTDVVMFSQVPLIANIYYLEAGADNSKASAVQVYVTEWGGTSVKLKDIISTAFGKNSTSGALLIGTDAPGLKISSRTYNLQPAGTYGQYIPAVPAENALGPGDVGTLIQLTGNGDFRANLGFASFSGAQTLITIQLFKGDGTSLGTLAYPLKPFGQLQVNGVLTLVTSEQIDNAYAFVSSATPGCSYVAYASIIDNHSGDPICIPAKKIPASGGPFTYFIAAAAKAAGAQGTNWKTDLVAFNPGDASVTAQAYFLEGGLDNSGAAPVDLKVQAHSSVRVTDAIQTLFGKNGTSGAIRIESATALAVTSRTYNDQGAAGTYGQFIPAFGPEDAIAAADNGYLIQLSQDDAYRTNAGLVNAAASSLDVTATAYAEDGTLIGTKDFNLLPYEQLQTNAILSVMGSGKVSNAYITLQATTAGGEYYAYASVVDNATGDAIFIPAK